jgi:zinc transport system substrate-binding protein
MTAMCVALSLLTACDIETPADGPASSAGTSNGPKIVASTTWVGGFAKAAGATDITIIASADLQHPPDYDPKPSDLAAVAKADYVLFSDFDGFAAKIKDAAGGKAKLVPVKLENTAEVIKAEVARLAQLFGTASVAADWLSTFDRDQAALAAGVRSKTGSQPRAAISHVFMAYWGNFAGLTIVGTFGPEPVTPSQLAVLTAKKPELILANAHLPGTPEVAGARRVDLINYPGSDLDLMSVFRTNTDRLAAALVA